jgi:hypothetical protein
MCGCPQHRGLSFDIIRAGLVGSFVFYIFIWWRRRRGNLRRWLMKVLIPLAIVTLLVTGIVKVALSQWAARVLHARVHPRFAVWSSARGHRPLVLFQSISRSSRAYVLLGARSSRDPGSCTPAHCRAFLVVMLVNLKRHLRTPDPRRRSGLASLGGLVELGRLAHRIPAGAGGAPLAAMPVGKHRGSGWLLYTVI